MDNPVTDITKSARQSPWTVGFTLVMLAWLAFGLVFYIINGDWENAFLALLVIGLIVVPAFILRQYRVHVPAEFQFIAGLFVFLSLFLGSAYDFYYEYWWWDIVLHTSSGFLLGIVGWVVLFLLNQTDRLPKGIRPEFLCFFGVTFAVFLGVVWEIFEFVMDAIWPHLNMMSRETGVRDTMYDLIVNLVGAVVVAAIGWAHFKWGGRSYIADAVKSFTQKNPRWFRKGGGTRKAKKK